MTEGRCLCGALRYQIDGPFVDMLHCHCSMCRKHHGTPFATWAAAPIAGFRWLGDTSSLATYRSSERGHRDFCRICGSVAPMVEENLGMVIAPAGNLEGDPGLRPTRHMFVGSKAGWYKITDDLPQHAEYPPEFGMPSTPRAPVELKPGVTQGSCLCGEVAYEITTPPLRMFQCHCSRCRQGRSAAHGANVFYDARVSAGPAVPDSSRSSSCRARSISPPRSAATAARHCRAFPWSETSSWCRPGRSTASQPSHPPHTFSWVRRRPGSTSPTCCRSSRRCRRGAETCRAAGLASHRLRCSSPRSCRRAWWAQST